MESAYKTLESSPSDSFDEIREKFIRKIIKIHPDKDELKSEEAKVLTEAWAFIKEHHNNNNIKTEPVATVVSHKGQDSEMKQFLKKIYNEGKVEKLEDKEEEKTWFSTLYDYLWGDDSDEEEETQEATEADESKLYNEVDKVETSNDEKIEKTLRE